MANSYTVKELIEHLQTTYEPDEVVAYTLYSKGDVESILKYDHNREDIDPDEVWKEIADEVEGALDGAQESVSEFLSERVSEEVDLYEEPQEVEQ